MTVNFDFRCNPTAESSGHITIRIGLFGSLTEDPNLCSLGENRHEVPKS
jgi:hypothetical protein